MRVAFFSPYSVREKENQQKAEEGNEYRDLVIKEDDEEERAFWEEPVPYTPEARLEAHRYIEEKNKAKENRYNSNALLPCLH